MKMDPQAIYIQLGHLIEAMPALLADQLPQSRYQWLGKAHALVRRSKWPTSH
jgi:hypothetical protein